MCGFGCRMVSAIELPAFRLLVGETSNGARRPGPDHLAAGLPLPSLIATGVRKRATDVRPRCCISLHEQQGGGEGGWEGKKKSGKERMQPRRAASFARLRDVAITDANGQGRARDLWSRATAAVKFTDNDVNAGNSDRADHLHPNRTLTNVAHYGSAARCGAARRTSCKSSEDRTETLRPEHDDGLFQPRLRTSPYYRTQAFALPPRRARPTAEPLPDGGFSPRPGVRPRRPVGLPPESHGLHPDGERDPRRLVGPPPPARPVKRG